MSADSGFHDSIACPFCGVLGNRVINSRPRAEYIYRRRECANLHKFTTYETSRIQPPAPDPVAPDPLASPVLFTWIPSEETFTRASLFHLQP